MTNSYEMMHKACSSIDKVPHCFSRSSVKFQGHTALKIVEFDPNWAATPVWIHRWLWNVAQSLKQQRRGALLFSKVIHQISRSHGTKPLILTQIGRFRTIGRLQLSNPSDLPCLTMFPSSYHHEIFRSYYQWQKWCPCKKSRSKVKDQGHRGHNPT